MSTPIDPTDDELIDELRRTLDVYEPLPEHIAIAAADAAFRLQRADDVVAELVADSAVDPVPATATRGDDGERVIRFTAAGREIELTLGLEPRVAVGQISPSEGAELGLETVDQHVPVELDEGGRFRITGLPRSFRLVVGGTPGGARRGRTVTPWVFI